MLEVRETGVFPAWLRGLRDAEARAKIAVRVRRLAHGNAGDVRPVGGGLSELRIHHGPGYRVHFVQRGAVLVVLPCGGDKPSQPRDIATARALADGSGCGCRRWRELMNKGTRSRRLPP